MAAKKSTGIDTEQNYVTVTLYISLLAKVVIADIFLSERGQTDRQTQPTALPHPSYSYRRGLQR